MMKFVVGILTLCFGAVLAFENDYVEDMDIMALRILSGHNLTNGTVSGSDTKYTTEIVNSIATSKTVNTTQIQEACDKAAVKTAVKKDLATFLNVAAADITVGTCVAKVKAAAGAGRRLAGHAGKSFTATIPVEILVKKGTMFNKDSLSTQEYADSVGGALKTELSKDATTFGTVTVTSAKPKAPTVTDPNATTTSTSTTTTTTVAGGEEDDTTTTTTTTKKASKKKATTTTSTTTTSGATSNVVGISLVLSALMMLNRF